MIVPVGRSIRSLLWIAGTWLVLDTIRVVWDRPGSFESLTEIRIRVNSDPAERLRLLPGIGPVIADRVIRERSIRPFRDCDDFTARVRGIGPAFLSDFADWLDFESSEAGVAANRAASPWPGQDAKPAKPS